MIMMRVTPAFKDAVEKRALELHLDMTKYITALILKDQTEKILPTPKSRRLILKTSVPRSNKPGNL